MPTRPDNFFENLAGTPVHYDREPVAPYGGKGLPRKFHCIPDLQTTLEAMFVELFAGTPTTFGAPRIILSAGAFVNKPGQHGLGKAFDLDGIHWENRSLIANQQRTDKVLYLAIQSMCHKHFGVVLGFNYNQAHQDHLHIDIGRAVRFRETKSVTFFIQEALNTLFDQALDVDGEFGPNTEAALRDARKGLGIGSLQTLSNWSEFLGHVSTLAFGVAAQQSALAGGTD